MSYSEKLSHVAVLGAAGKMGSGILLLTALEMFEQSTLPENQGKSFLLDAIDLSPEALKGLRKYLAVQAKKNGEKKTVWLRSVYANRADLIENEQIIDQYVQDVVDQVSFTTRIESAYDAHLVFEAASENPDLKVKLFKQIDVNSSVKPWFLTNTSSIPISYLDQNASLGGRIIGFHFYNPPAVQKLAELISAPATLPELTEFSLQFASRLRKTVVKSNDVAGFIGNGHFMRDLLFASSTVARLSSEFSVAQALYIVDKVSRDYLVRPMGIFQLTDYVGVDVCSYILSVMDRFIPGRGLRSELVDSLLSMNIKGGQFSDGSQKDGIFKYQKGAPVAVINPENGEYLPLTEVAPACDSWLGALPQGWLGWKQVMRLADREAHLASHFAALRTMPDNGAKLALEYAQWAAKVAHGLVSDGVANSTNDVNTVMMTGFFHSHGPVNNF
jgi:3-hydroxyacyl-CoA dehydrogenase